MEEIELPGKDGKMYFVDLSLVPENMTPQQFLDSRFTEVTVQFDPTFFDACGSGFGGVFTIRTRYQFQTF